MSGSWTGLANVGSAVQFNVTQTKSVDYPLGIVAGQPIFFALCAGPAGQAVPTLSDTDFQVAVSRTTTATTHLLWKIANGTETGTITCNRGTASGQAYAQMATFNGGPASITGNVHASSGTGGGAALGLNYPSLTITADNCLVIALGCKPNNCSGFNVPSPFDAEIDESNSSAGMCMVWDYAIQTAAASISSGSWTITTDVSSSRNTVIAAFLSGAIATARTRALMGVGS
jgi:hypothetical protein